MRLKLILKPVSKKATISYNYQYFLHSLIYKAINKGSQDFSEFLHDEGYKLDGKNFKLFTFSWLDFFEGNFNTTGDGITLYNSPRIKWYITSPIKDFIQYLADGILQDSIRIKNTVMNLEKVKTCSSPDFYSEMIFDAISPITMSTGSVEDGEMTAHYFRADEDFSEQITNNLKRKYYLINGKKPKEDWFVDFNYLPGAEDKSKLIKFKQTKIHSYLAPFKISGSKKLIEIGYEAGFGDKNSLGFGMAEVRKEV